MKTLLLVSLLSLPLAAQTCSLTDDSGLTTDQSAALQACINSATDYSTITIAMTGTPGRMPHVRVNQTIRVNGRYNLAIECPGGHTMSSGAPGFYWGGADGGTLVNTSGSSAIRIEHCNFFSSIGSALGANVLIDVDISSTVKSPVTTTEHLYNDLGLNSNNANPNFAAVRFSASGDANVEAMKVTGSRVQCQGNTGIGLYIAGYTFDAIRHRYTDNDFSNCEEGIRALFGMPTINNNHFEKNTIDITALASPIHIFDNDSEGAGQFFVGQVGTVVIESNRIAACHPPTGQGCLQTNGAVISRGNLFNALNGVPIFSLSNGKLIDEGDVFPDYNQFLVGAETFYQFEAKALNWGWGISIMGGLEGGNAIVFDCNNGKNAAKAPNVIVLCANGFTNALQVSENGGTFENVIPILRRR